MQTLYSADAKLGTTVNPDLVEIVERDYTGQRDAAYRVTQALYQIFGIAVGLVGVRLILRASGVNANSDLPALLYSLTEPLVRPFATLLRTLPGEGAVFETHSLIAVVVYALLGWGAGRLVWAVARRKSTPPYNAWLGTR